MSRKHVINYYNDVCKQYNDFVEEIKDFENCVADGIVAPEVMDNIKTILEPLKSNWQMMNYIIYLLNLPNKKEKEKRYRKQNPAKNCITDEEIKQENDKCIKEMKDFKDDIRSKI